MGGGASPSNYYTSCLAPSPSPTASHPRVGTGNAIAAYAARRSGDPATDPHSGTRDSLSLTALPLAAPRPAPSAQSVSRPTSWVLCRVCIPLSTFPILLLCSARCIAARNSAAMRTWASGRSYWRPGPATSWPAAEALRGPRRTSDISQQVTCRPKSEKIC